MGDSSDSGHPGLLALYCRICGRRNVKAPTPHIEKNNGVHFDREPDYKTFLSRLHEADTSGENGEIFPKKVCQSCVDLFRSGIAVQVKNSEGKTVKTMAFFDLVKSLFISMRTQDLRDLQNKFPLADYWAHSSSSFQGCAVCQDGGSGVDVMVSASYTELTTRPNLAPNQKVKTLITVRNMTKDEMGGDYFPDDSGESFKILEIKTGIVTIQPAAQPRPAAASPSGGPSPAARPGATAGPAALAARAKAAAAAADGDIQEVAVVSGAKRPVGAGAGPASKKTKVEGGAGVDPWPTFNEILGQNKKYRADKLGEIMNLYQVETPKVISDLKGAGISYQSTGGKTHFVKNAEFKKSLNKCLSLLAKVNTPNKSRLMFKGINETAADGQLSLLKHVGINIDLTHPKLSMLKIRIRNSQNEANSPSKKTTTIDVGTKKGIKAIAKGKNGAGPDSKDPVPALPRGITISKVGGSPTKDDEPMSARKKRLANLNHHYSEEARPEVSSFPGNAPLPVKLRIGAKPKIVALKKKLDELWPANRQMRADILREFILGKAGCKQLLFARGVVFEFDQARGDFHLPEHKSQRIKHKKQADKLTERLSDDEWADFTCEVVFDLLHPEDTLTLRVVGLFVDPLSANAPLHFRLLFALKKTLKIDEDKALSKQVMGRAATMLEEDGKRPGDADMVNAVITLLYCEEFEAMEIWKNAGGRAVKPSPAAAATPAGRPKPGPKSKTQSGPGPSSSAVPPSGPRSAKKSSYVGCGTEDDDDPLSGKKKGDSDAEDYVPDVNDDDDDDYGVEVLPKSSRRNVRPPRKFGDDQFDSSAKKATTPASAKKAAVTPAAAAPTPPAGGRGRGRPPSKPILLGIKKKQDVSVSLERIDPLAASGGGGARSAPGTAAKATPAKTGYNLPVGRGSRGPYNTKAKKAAAAVAASPAEPSAGMVGNKKFHGNQFYDRNGRPKRQSLPTSSSASPAPLTSAKLQLVAYENAEAGDPLGGGGGGGGDPLSGGGGGDPLDSIVLTPLLPNSETEKRPTRIAREETAADDIDIEENPIEDRSPPVSPPAMSEDDDYQPLAVSKKSSNKKKAPSMGPKSKRKQPSPLEADNLMDDAESQPSRNGGGGDDGNNVSEPESSPVKSKDPFQIANDEMYSDEEEDDDDMALTSIISHSVGGARGGPSPKPAVKAPPPRPKPKPASVQQRDSSNGGGGGFDPFAAINEPDPVNGNDGYGEDQSEEDFLAELLGVTQ